MYRRQSCRQRLDDPVGVLHHFDAGRLSGFVVLPDKIKFSARRFERSLRRGKLLLEFGDPAFKFSDLIFQIVLVHQHRVQLHQIFVGGSHELVRFFLLDGDDLLRFPLRAVMRLSSIGLTTPQTA